MRMENGNGGYRERFVRSFLDWLVLSILRGRPAYGHEVILSIEEEFPGFVSPGSLYPILYSLEQSGLGKGRRGHPERRWEKGEEPPAEGGPTARGGPASTR